jgi:hypothetical protein
VLWVAVIGLYFALVRRIAGTRAAALAAAAVTALAGWGVLLVWSQGAQDLWMLFFALLALHAVLRDRPGRALAAQLLALLSKETAALLPVAAFGLEWLVRGRRPAAALRRVAPMLALAVAWAVLHPLLGGRLWWPRPHEALPGLHPPAAIVAGRTLLALVNLHEWPTPEAGWAAALRTAVPGLLVLLALVVLLARDGRRGRSARPALLRTLTPASPGRAAAFGGLWALCGWGPLFMPTIGWHAYHGLFGALGAWLALAVPLARVPRAAWLAVAVLAVLRAGQATTPVHDWGTEWFQRRAATFSEESRAELLRLRPTLPPGSRVFLSGAPGGAGLLPGGGQSPPLRYWYRDHALRVAAWERYRQRAGDDTEGEDVFLRYDRAAGWREVAPWASAPDTAAGTAPPWRDDLERLAVVLARGGDWEGAFAAYERLARAFPVEPTYTYYAGLSRAASGDSAGARRWVLAAAALPAADEEILAAASRMADGR